MKRVLITGASSGIGYELAKVYAKNNNNLILIARRKYKLEKLKKEILDNISNKIEITVIEKDLGKLNAAKELFYEIEKMGLEVDVLINNAGFGIYGKFSNLSWDEMKRNNEMIDLNIRLLVELTKLYLDKFLKRNDGSILNVASIAGFIPGPLMANYYASKSYVLSFTEALREEVLGTKVKIGVLCPGPTDTEFEKSSNADEGGLFSKLKVMSAEKVAKISYKEFENGKRIIIPGIMNKTSVFMLRFLPRSLATKVSRKIQEKK
ncbi:MAG: SDR family oxidoreductase [Leptotrichiaceae bacterium]|nr:SDR family oxidoreductase [Leptotrichiaceae bacterium]